MLDTSVLTVDDVTKAWELEAWEYVIPLTDDDKEEAGPCDWLVKRDDWDPVLVEDGDNWLVIRDLVLTDDIDIETSEDAFETTSEE